MQGRKSQDGRPTQQQLPSAYISDRPPAGPSPFSEDSRVDLPVSHPSASPRNGAGLSRHSSATHVRVRSSNAICTMDPSPNLSHPASPEGSPNSPSSGSSRNEVHAPLSGGIVDSYVHLRKIVTKVNKPHERHHRMPYFSWFKPGSYLRLCTLERRIVAIIVLGMLFGALMHGLVFWHGMSNPSMGSSISLPTSGKPGQSASTKKRLNSQPLLGRMYPSLSGVPGSQRATVNTTHDEAVKLGMPGDSDRLPNTPVWQHSMFEGLERIPPESDKWPNTAAICSIMKGEHPEDVLQWLRYHKWIGVNKVFLRENADEVPPRLAERLQPLIDEGFLDLGALPGPKHPLQNRWYNRCSKPDLAGKHSWVAFIDLDEFMVILEEGEAAKKPDLKKVLSHFKGNAGISMQWVLFGSSGHVKRPTPGGPLAYYYNCTGKLSFQMKCMANMYHATHHMMVGNTVHDCTYRLANETGVDVQKPIVTTTDGTPLRLYENTDMTNPDNDPAFGKSRTYRGHLDKDSYDSKIRSEHQLVLFHYVTRSLEDYTSRKIKLPSGIYTHNYVTAGNRRNENVAEAAVLARFEKENGFDGSDDICSSVPRNFYVGQCCSGRLGAE